MFKKLFGPAPETFLLSEIRNRLIPLGFIESKDGTYPFRDFSRGDLLVRWIKDYREQIYALCIYVGINPIQRLDGTFFESPKLVTNIHCPLSNTGLNGIKDNILKTLDDWLKTI